MAVQHVFPVRYHNYIIYFSLLTGKIAEIPTYFRFLKTRIHSPQKLIGFENNMFTSWTSSVLSLNMKIFYLERNQVSQQLVVASRVEYYTVGIIVNHYYKITALVQFDFIQKNTTCIFFYILFSMSIFMLSLKSQELWYMIRFKEII